jgi:phosphoribosyl-AMP cyclohydrolase
MYPLSRRPESGIAAMPARHEREESAMGHDDFPDRLPATPGLRGILDALKFNSDGLVTVVSQDAKTGEVLMLAWANRDAVEKSLITGLMHYYSRSRQKMWLKGEESGHVQKLVSLAADCDGDALLAQVRQVKGACHMGFRSCFSFKISKDGKMKVIGKKVFDPHKAYGK